jgi:hypothetical protein
MSSLTFAVNENNDLFLDSIGNIALARDLQSVLQQSEQAVKTLLGECVYDVNRGLPFFQVLWRGNPNITQFVSYLRQAILDVDGVIEVVSITTDKEDNVFSYTAEIRTIYGTGVISDQLEGS